MVYLVGVLQYPHTKGEQAGKKFLTLQKTFSNIYRKGEPAKRILGFVRSELEGIQTMTIWEVTGDIKDALSEVTKIYLELSEIEGAKYALKTYMSIMEALPLIGLKAPE
jgi:hypothetical protein